MTRFFQYITIVLLLLTQVTCSKEDTFSALSEPVRTQPVFFLEGLFNETPLNLIAGDDGFFMFTSFVKTDLQTNLIGELAHESGCEADCRSIKMILNNYQLLEGVPFSSDDIQLPHSLPLAPNHISQDHQVTYRFNVLQTADNESTHVWEFISSGNDLMKSVSGDSAEITIDSSFTFTAKLTSTTIEDCVSSYEKAMGPLTVESTVPDCNCEIIVAEEAFNELLLHTDCTNEYTWSNNSLEIEVSIEGNDEICLIAGNPALPSCTACIQTYLIDNTAVPGYCQTSFTHEKTPPVPHAETHSPYMTVMYTDEAGTLFSTTYANDVQNGSLEIEKAISYDNNDNGEPTFLLTINMNGILHAQNGQSINVSNLTGNIGFAFP